LQRAEGVQRALFGVLEFDDGVIRQLGAGSRFKVDLHEVRPCAELAVAVDRDPFEVASTGAVNLSRTNRRPCDQRNHGQGEREQSHFPVFLSSIAKRTLKVMLIGILSNLSEVTRLSADSPVSSTP